MKRLLPNLCGLLMAVLLAVGLPRAGEAKSYSSGSGRSYSSSSTRSSSTSGSRSASSSPKSSAAGSSHTYSSGGSKSAGSAGGHTFSSGGSSHSSPSTAGSGAGTERTAKSSPSKSVASRSSTSDTGGGKTFSAGTGRSYSSASAWSDDSRHSYSSGKSYTAGSGLTFSSGAGTGPSPATAKAPRTDAGDASPASFAFDSAAARARKQAASKESFARFNESQAPPPRPANPAVASRSEPAGVSTPSRVATVPTPPSAAPPVLDPSSYRVKPPPLPVASSRPQSSVYVPDQTVIVSRPARVQVVFGPYASRPVVTYRDPYNSFFWWWLLDRSLEDRAVWAYHHRADMDPVRYQALVDSDRELETRVEQLEAQQVARDPSYTPPELDRDLMYSDGYVARTYSTRPTPAGVLAFWGLGIPTALAVSGFFLWLIWFKRWPTPTATNTK
jgi:hypothetical protein